MIAILVVLWSGGWLMYTGEIVFAQVIDHLPMHTFRRCVAHYGGEHKLKSFACLDQ